MSPEAAWAELIRYEGLTTEPELDTVRMPVWCCRYPKAMLVDLTAPANQAKHGITEDALTGDSWSACQALGQTLRLLHASGVIAPCAALPGHTNVTMFGPLRKIDWRDRSALARAVPATVVAIGRPPVGLIGDVRRPSSAAVPNLF